MGFNRFWMLVTFQYRGLHHLDMYCTSMIEAWLKSNIHFDCRYLELWNVCIISLIFIVLINVRDGTESKYPSIVFLGILIKRYIKYDFFVIWGVCLFDLDLWPWERSQLDFMLWPKTNVCCCLPKWIKKMKLAFWTNLWLKVVFMKY